MVSPKDIWWDKDSIRRVSVENTKSKAQSNKSNKAFYLTIYFKSIVYDGFRNVLGYIKSYMFYGILFCERSEKYQSNKTI